MTEILFRYVLISVTVSSPTLSPKRKAINVENSLGC